MSSLIEFNRPKMVNSKYVSKHLSIWRGNTETINFYKSGELIVLQGILKLGRARASKPLSKG